MIKATNFLITSSF